MDEQDKIIEQIEDKLFKEGFYKTTMDEVASELGMSKKTIYKFFPSKDDLVMAIAKHFMNVMKSKIVPALNTDKIKEFCQKYWIADSASTQDEFGRTFTKLENGARITYNWYRENKWL